jgi:hypothetical protein
MIAMYLLSRMLLTCLATCCLFAVYSQKHRENYTISLPEQKIPDSRYNSLLFIDGRADTSNMGIVQLGAFNKKALVIAETPLGQQFHTIFDSLIDASAKQGECVFLLRQLSFAEVTKAMSERGYCYLRAALFAKTGEGYQKINTIDPVILVKAFDVTRAMFRRGSKTIHEFIGQNLQKAPEQERLYSLSDIHALDSVEKRSIPVYNTTAYTEGVYETYEAFKQQKPDRPNAIIETDKAGLFVVKETNEKGKKEKIKSKELYGMVYQGNPYVATEFGYYPLDKRMDNFYFTGKTRVAASQGDIMAASVFFGLLGGLLASQPVESMFEMKIDHVGGGFIRLKEVPSSSQ